MDLTHDAEYGTPRLLVYVLVMPAASQPSSPRQSKRRAPRNRHPADEALSVGFAPKDGNHF
jgi:hypothetical protein